MNNGMVEFAGSGDMVPGYLALPDGKGPFPGVVVIQEWWGLTDHIKDAARRFAAEGFAALAPDMYRGQVALEPDEARKLAMELQHEQAIIDMQSAVDYLIGLGEDSPKKIGIVGFCMGGGLTALMAYRGRNLGAVVVFYGNIRDMAEDDAASKVSAPLMGNFGETDNGLPPDVIEQRGLNSKNVARRSISTSFQVQGMPPSTTHGPRFIMKRLPKRPGTGLWTGSTNI